MIVREWKIWTLRILRYSGELDATIYRPRAINPPAPTKIQLYPSNVAAPLNVAIGAAVVEVAGTVGEEALGVTPAASQSFVPNACATVCRITISLTVFEKGKVKLARRFSRVTRGPDTSAVRRDEDGREAEAGCVRGRATAASDGTKGTGLLHPIALAEFMKS